MDTQTPVASESDCNRSTSVPEKALHGEDAVTPSPSEKGGEQASSSTNVESNKESPEGAAKDGTQYPSTFSLIFIVIALVLSIFLVALDMTIVATAIPRITDEFNSLDQVGWYGSAFFLTVASFQSTWGKGYKYFPLKWTYLMSIFVFEIGSLICAVARNSTTLIVGRAIAGAGAAGIASGVYTIIAFAAPARQRPAFTGLLGATYAFASVIGPLLGGVFTTHVSWRWCFYINLPIGALSSAIIVFFFKTPPAARPAKATWKEKLLQMDLAGTFIIMAAVVCYLLALQWGGATKRWSNPDVIGTLVAFGLLMIIFVVNEWWMGERALVPSRLVKDRNIATSSLYIVFLAGPMFILIYYLPIYFQSIKNVSAAQSGIRNIPLILSVSAFTIASGVLITLFGQFAYLMILGSIISAIGSGLLYMLDIDTPTGKWIGYQIVAGVGIGFGVQIPIIVNQALVSAEDLASVSAFTLFIQTITGAFWVSAAQSAFVNRLVQTLPETAPGINPALVVATGATQLRSTFSPEQLPGILAAYMDGLRLTFLLCIVLACVGVLVSFLPKWVNLKAKLNNVGGAA